MNADALFAALAEDFADQPDVSPPVETGTGRFRSATLKVSGAIFAMCPSGTLVVKRPADRVAALIAEGTAAPYDAGKGTPWRVVAAEAHDFVAARRRP